MTSKFRLLRVLFGALVLGAMGAFCALRLEVTTDVTEFLATGGDRELA